MKLLDSRLSDQMKEKLRNMLFTARVLRQMKEIGLGVGICGSDVRNGVANYFANYLVYIAPIGQGFSPPISFSDDGADGQMVENQKWRG